jgi:hypothetical protein
MFRPWRPQKTYAYYRQTVPAGSDIGRGSSSTLGVVSTFGGLWPGLGRRHGRKDLHLEGGHQHRAWAPRLGSPQGFRPERTPRLAAPQPQPAVPRGPQPSSRPRQHDPGVGPTSGRPGQAPATAAAPPRPGKPRAPRPTKPLFEPTPPSVHADTATSGSSSSQSS